MFNIKYKTMYKKIRYGHVTKSGGVSIEAAIRPVHPYIRHNHLPMCNSAQAIKQGIEFSFASVVDPVKRVVDQYDYFLAFTKDLTFNEWIAKLESGFNYFYHFAPQHIYVQNGDYKVDKIIRLEDFENGWKEVINGDLGIDTPMLHLNKTKVSRVKRVTKKQKERIYKLYKKDYEILKYTL